VGKEKRREKRRGGGRRGEEEWKRRGRDAVKWISNPVTKSEFIAVRTNVTRVYAKIAISAKVIVTANIVVILRGMNFSDRNSGGKKVSKDLKSEYKKNSKLHVKHSAA